MTKPLFERYLLVKFSGNWADEMDIDGFWIATQEQWEKYQRQWHEWFSNGDSFEWYIGTNESIEFEDYDDFMSYFDAEEISMNDATILQRHFRIQFGFVPDFPSDYRS